VKKLLIILLLISLMGNIYPVLNVVAIVGMFLSYVVWNRDRKPLDPEASPTKALWFLKLAYVYWFSSYILSGAPLGNLFSFDFIRRDGALFVAYLPLLLFGDLALGSRFVRRGLTLFLTCMALVATLGVLEFEDNVGVSVGLANLPDSLQFVHYAALSDFGFHGLFEAHNSAGAVYGLAACLALALLVYSPSANVFSARTFWFVTCFTGLTLSKSRTAYIAFVGTFALVFLTSKKHYRKVSKVAVFVLIPLIYFWLSQPQVTHRAAAISSLDDPNVIGRFEHFSEALYDINISPVVGIGFGRFNDESKKFSGIPHLLYFATGGDVVNDSSHAHNSYLHFLAEGGIVGLTLMLGVWISLLRWVRKIQGRFAETTFSYAFANGIQACIVFEFLISFTEHSMGTAVSSLLVLTMVGLLRNLITDQNDAIADVHMTSTKSRDLDRFGESATLGFRPA